MPSKKQRRRREKGRRHEYEYVVVDETGSEVEIAPTELKGAKPERKRAATSARAGRVVQPPSWHRVGRRALIFAPVMFAVIFLLGGKQVSTVGKLLQTFLLLAFFLPFSYLMDTLAYRAYRKRAERG